MAQTISVNTINEFNARHMELTHKYHLKLVGEVYERAYQIELFEEPVAGKPIGKIIRVEYFDRGTEKRM